MTSRPVPAATATLRTLSFLAGQPVPVPAARISAAIGLPRSSTYHLLRAMADEGFVTHYPEDKRWGIGIAAYEVGVGYARQQPIARLARVPIAQLVDRVGESAHLVTLHGREVVYVLEERAPGRPPLVSDVDVRLPAHLTASGRAILAQMTAAQVRALFPDQSVFVDRQGTGPRSPGALRSVLSQTRQRGYAIENGEVTPGFASVAAPVMGAEGIPIASVAVTYPTASADPAAPAIEPLIDATRRTAAEIARRLRGRSRSAST